MKKKQASPSAMISPRRRKASEEDRQTIRRRRSSRLSADELLSNIPIDLVIEIFSRLPLKSIARCRCVSKQWASALRRPDFTELFFTKSLARPQLLFAREKEKDVRFFTALQPQNLGENVSIMAADHHVSFPDRHLYHISCLLNGLVCIRDERFFKRSTALELVLVIYNLSTRQSFTLPKIKTGSSVVLRSFLGYDPIEKQHKVLAVIDKQHRVLTLGTGNLTWRVAECGIPHFSSRPDSVCINGVLYYAAGVSVGKMIACFDVRSEKYSFVKLMEREMFPATLINFQGKLASVRSSILSEKSTGFNMWILEDLEKHEWSKRIFNLPPTWKKEVAGEKYLYFVGVTATNEFVFAPLYPSDPFHVYYYKFVKEAVKRVEIQGMGTFDFVRIFLNHVEDVKLME